MSVLQSRSYATATTLVLAWCRWYTLGLPHAEARRSELESDLYEQAAEADAAGRSDARAAASAASRTLRGMPADFLWRWAQVRGLPPLDRTAFRGWRADRRVGSLTVLCGVVMTTWCLFVLARVATSVGRGDVAPATPASALVVGFAGICVCGTLLAARRRTRWLGALWLLAASQEVLHIGLLALHPSSAT